MNYLHLRLLKPSGCSDVDKLGEVYYITPHATGGMKSKVMFLHLTGGEIQVSRKKWKNEIRHLAEMHNLTSVFYEESDVNGDNPIQLN